MIFANHIKGQARAIIWGGGGGGGGGGILRVKEGPNHSMSPLRLNSAGGRQTSPLT